MPPETDTQGAFAAALLDARRPVPDGLTSRTGPRPLRRFNVYRNNVFASLIDVLQGRYPAVHRLVGDEFFRAAARLFVERHPPRSPVLLTYGGTFPGFLESFEPADGLPYLAGVARLEWAWNEAYHAADARPLGPAELAAVAPADVPTAVLSLHPSLGVVRSRHAVVTIWTAMTGDDEVTGLDLPAGGEDALVIRPALEVEVRRLPAGAADFLTALAGGGSLLAAAEAGAGAAPAFDLDANLAELIRCGAICGIAAGDEAATGKERHHA